jgi:hypothetical protein
MTAPSAKLTASLAKAQAACHAVAKDATNAQHGYKYVTAESIITEARAALATAGLVLLPTSQVLKGDRILRRFQLVDQASGESAVLTSVWPVVPQNGRPMDKAVAAADTLSLAYLLRDLLLMPRVEAGTDVAGRDDTQYKAPPARITDAQRDELAELVRVSGADVKKLLAFCKVKVLKQLPAAHFPKLKALLQKKIDRAATRPANSQAPGIAVRIAS